MKLTKALGATVTAILRSNAMSIGAADKFVAMNEEGDVASAGKSLDLILDTVSVDHEVMAYNGMLDVNGIHVLLGFLKD